MGNLYKVPTENALQYTLDSQLAAGETSSLTLNTNVESVVQAPGLIVIDRIDSSESKTPSKREYIVFTGVSGSTLTGLTRGLAGSSDQVHSVGAIVEFVNDVVQAQAIYDAITLEHLAANTPGMHVSLPSVSQARIAAATITNLGITNSVNASGASIAGLVPVRPTWVIPAIASAASTTAGPPVDMPAPGTIEFVSVVLSGPVSSASLVIDINKNFASIFDAGTRPSILGGGTYVSTASINTKIFNRGDVFTVDVDAVGNQVDATVKFHAR